MIRIFAIVVLLSNALYAQDTLRITLEQADSLLVINNLSLIAFHFEIDKAEAARIQARLLYNPSLFTEWNLHNPDVKRWVDAGPNGQRIIGIEQVFRIAGQRNLGVKLAEEERRMTTSQYKEMVRSLRYELHVAFYRYHFLNSAIINIRSQLGLLKDLIDVYGDQYRKGNISLQELTRLNTTYFTINSQVKEVQQELVSMQETLRVLLREDRFIDPRPTDITSFDLSGVRLEELIRLAIDNRPEIQTIRHIERQYELKHSLSRRRAIPDLRAGILYDQAGSYVNRYTAFTIGLEIPIFNRNQGEVRAARAGIDQAKVLMQSKEQQIRSEVNAAWNVLHILEDQHSAVDAEYEQELSLLSAGLVSNYSKSNISLLEFTDLFESYNTNIIQYNQLKADLIKAHEELIYAVGEDIRR